MHGFASQETGTQVPSVLSSSSWLTHQGCGESPSSWRQKVIVPLQVSGWNVHDPPWRTCLNTWSPAGGAVLGGWDAPRRWRLAGGSVSQRVAPPPALCFLFHHKCSMSGEGVSAAHFGHPGAVSCQGLPPGWILHLHSVNRSHFLPLSCFLSSTETRKEPMGSLDPVDFPSSPHWGSSLFPAPWLHKAAIQNLCGKCVSENQPPPSPDFR